MATSESSFFPTFLSEDDYPSTKTFHHKIINLWNWLQQAGHEEAIIMYLLWEVWCLTRSCSFSTTTTFACGNRSTISRAVANPTIPHPPHPLSDSPSHYCYSTSCSPADLTKSSKDLLPHLLYMLAQAVGLTACYTKTPEVHPCSARLPSKSVPRVRYVGLICSLFWIEDLYLSGH